VLLAAFTAANAADGIRAVALPLVAVELTKDPILVASLGVAQSLPYLMVGLPAGVVIDRVDRRRLLAVTNAVEAVLFILVLAGVLLDALTLGLLYLAAVSLGTNETLRDTAAATAVPAVVPISQLETDNGRLVTAEFIANQLIGPALGAALFTVAMAVPFALSAGLAAMATVLTLRLPRLNRDPVPAIVTSATMSAEEARRAALRMRATRLASEVADGVGFLSRHPVLRTVAFLAVVLTLTDAAWFVVLVLLVTEELRLDGSAYGLILAVAAIGGAAGGLGSGRLVDRLGSATVLRGGLLVIGVAQVVIGTAGSALVVIAALAIGNGAFAVWLTAAASLRQALTPRSTPRPGHRCVAHGRSRCHPRRLAAGRTLRWCAGPARAVSGRRTVRARCRSVRQTTDRCGHHRRPRQRPQPGVMSSSGVPHRDGSRAHGRFRAPPRLRRLPAPPIE